MIQRLALSPPRLSIQLASDMRELGHVREFCRKTIDSYWRGADAEIAIAKLQLAADEAVVNVIRHGVMVDDGKTIECTASVQHGQIHVCILHHGCPFQSPQEVPPVTEPREGGMGLFLIERCVDHVCYEQAEDGRQCIRLSLDLT